MADRIVRELEDTGHQSASDYAWAQRWDSLNFGDTDLAPAIPRVIDLRVAVDPGATSAAGVDRAISEALELASSPNPAPESIRISQAGAGARVIRATGNGWTLAARTGEPPVVLLLTDQVPGCLMDISDFDAAPRLLTALSEAAGQSEEG